MSVCFSSKASVILSLGVLTVGGLFMFAFFYSDKMNVINIIIYNIITNIICSNVCVTTVNFSQCVLTNTGCCVETNLVGFCDLQPCCDGNTADQTAQRSELLSDKTSSVTHRGGDGRPAMLGTSR